MVASGRQSKREGGRHRNERMKERLMANDGGSDIAVLRGQYWLTRVVFLRCLGFVYMVAFIVALNDNGALVSCSLAMLYF